jgi:deoxycytidylate deaminase
MTTPLLRYLQATASGYGHTYNYPSDVRLRSKLRTFISFTDELGELSACKRLEVGCTIITPSLTEVLAIGYNGPPSGEPNDGCREEDVGNCGCVHGEANALIRLRDRRDGLILLTTQSPCEHCAGLIVNHQGIAAVLYGTEYRNQAGVNLLKRRELTVLPWGYVLYPQAEVKVVDAEE